MAVHHCCFVGPDFKARNAVVAHKWAELAEEERKQWASRAEAVCSSSVQVIDKDAL